MKKLLFLAVLCSSFILASPAAADTADTVVKLHAAAPVFKGAKKVAVFSKDTQHTVTGSDQRFYYTNIGDLQVKFSKQYAKTIKRDADKMKSANPVRLLTKKHTKVYINRNTKSQVLGQLQPNEILFTQRLKGDYYPVVFGGKTGYIYRKDVEIQKGVPVIMYHDLVKHKTGSSDSILEVDKFAEQMAFLKKHNWHTISIEELNLWLQKKIKLPEKSVLITFDDGYSSTADLAYPILKKYQFKATSFLIASRIDRYGYLKTEQIQAISDVFSFQNHTYDLHSFNSMTGLAMLEYIPRIEIYQDIYTASQKIQNILPDQPAVTALAYPYGIRGTESIRAAKVAGIKIAFTITEGNVFKGDSPFHLNRQRVHSGMSLQEFHKKLLGQ